jgi:hypothetical protein
MATWRGSIAIQEDPNSPQIQIDVNGWKRVRIYNGQYSILNAAAPPRGALTADGMVDVVDLKRAPGGRGILTVTYGPYSFAGLDAPGGLQEIEWVEVQKKLEQHPRYQIGGPAALTASDLDKIEDWRTTTSATERASKFSALSFNAQDFAAKVNRGQDSWVIYAPVARQTLRSQSEPTAGGCGVIQSPPPLIAITGYQYLKTADRVSGQGTHWEQTREWTGADSWDSEIYPFG